MIVSKYIGGDMCDRDKIYVEAKDYEDLRYKYHHLLAGTESKVVCNAVPTLDEMYVINGKDHRCLLVWQEIDDTNGRVSVTAEYKRLFGTKIES